MQQITCGFLELSKCNSDFFISWGHLEKRAKEKKNLFKNFLKIIKFNLMLLSHYLIALN